MPPPGPTLFGSALPPTRSLMTTWAFGAGWVMSCAAYASMLGSDNPVGLLLAIPAAALSGGAVYWAGRVKKPSPLQIVGSTIFASCLCPTVTVAPLVLWEVFARGLQPAGEMVGMLVCVGVAGALLLVPFGMVFGTLFAVAWHAIDSGRDEGHRSALEIAWMAFGGGWMLVGVSLLLIDWFPHRFTPASHSGPTLIVTISCALALLGAVVFLFGVAHRVRRRRLAERARRGKLPGYAVVPANEVESPNRLPTLFPEGPFDAVLVRREGPSGPFRDGPDVPLARLAR